ncbi:MAG: hypothetical protein U1E76_02645 [Planctomycetota bacterium]
MIDAVAFGDGLFGRDIIRRPAEFAGRGERRQARLAGETKVGQDRRAIRPHDDVGRLDVAVDDAGPVRVVERVRHLGHQQARGRPLTCPLPEVDRLPMTAPAASCRMRTSNRSRESPSISSIAKKCVPACSPIAWISTMPLWRSRAAVAASLRKRKTASSRARNVTWAGRTFKATWRRRSALLLGQVDLPMPPRPSSRISW